MRYERYERPPRPTRGKKKRRRRGIGAYNRVFILFLIIFGLVYGGVWLVGRGSEKAPESDSEASKSLAAITPEAPPLSNPASEATPIPITTPAPKQYEITSALDLFSPNAILTHIGDSLDILYEKDSNMRIYPASLTKIMTAIVAIENLNDLDTLVLLNESMFPYIIQERASMAGFLQNEEVPAVDLLYGLMLPSGAECAIGLAEFLAGSEDDFVQWMNVKARALNLRGTHFTNTSGLHDEAHYSTVSDMAVLLNYALQNEFFQKIFTTAHFSTQPTNLHTDGITFYSTLFARMQSPAFDGGVILGGKTGFTNEAGRCLASLAEVDGELFILVTCGASVNSEITDPHIADAFTTYAAIGRTAS